MTTPTKFYTVPEVAELFRLGKQTVYNRIALGEWPIPIIRIGSRVLMSVDHVDGYIEAQYKKQA